MTFESLENGVEQINRLYLPFGVEHDPRIAPIGRVVACRLKALEDGEYGLEGDIEVFEPGDDLPLQDDGRQIPLRSYPANKLQIIRDMAFEGSESTAILAELSEQLGAEQAQEMKKALEPIAVLIIGGAGFLLGQLAQGFLNRLGEDGYEALKAKVQKLVERRHGAGKDTLLEISLVVPVHGHEVEIDIHCTNPTTTEIEDVVLQQLQRIDDALPSLADPQLGIRRLVFEYKEDDLHLRFAVRRDAVPLFPQFHEQGGDENNA